MNPSYRTGPASEVKLTCYARELYPADPPSPARIPEHQNLQTPHFVKHESNHASAHIETSQHGSVDSGLVGRV